MNQEIISLLSHLAEQEIDNIDLSNMPTISPKPHQTGRLLPLFAAICSEGAQHARTDWASHMTPTIDYPGLVGHFLAAQHNGNLLSPRLYPLLTHIEEQTLQWLCQLFSFPMGHFTSGSTAGTLEALWQARETYPERAPVVYASRAAHYSVAKACRILGLSFQVIATDADEKICLAALRDACNAQTPLAIVATAGTPASGAIDPIARCVRLAQHFGAWLHIDAAWGGCLALVPEERHWLEGMAEADSLCFDPHKTLGQPKPTSLLCYRQPIQLTLDDAIDYLDPQPPTRLIGSHGGEHCLSLWSTLMLTGTDAITQSIRDRLDQAAQFATGLAAHTNWAQHNPTGIVCFTLEDSAPELTTCVTQGVFSRATVNGQAVYRAVFADNNTQATALLARLTENH